ncbi:MAG: site-specific tyrosine recombinase XerD [Bacteroidales bacterium]|nr:site-specific tyrosine recombinase XerD [Bacteroidales bacterium]
MDSRKNTLKEYESYIVLERSLSENTRVSYMQELQKFDLYLDKIGFSGNFAEVDTDMLREYIRHIASQDIAATSQSHAISAIKSLYKFLLVDDQIDDDPTELIETPKLARHLPTVLTVEEIESIIRAIDVSTELGHRNRAIIEVLYGCGLRVSELVGLRLSDLFFGEEFIRVVGKGDKQRLVPIGHKAMQEIDNYMKSFRNHIVPQKGSGDILFLNRNGKKLTRAMIFTIIKQTCKAAGIEKTVSPHTFRHSFATHLIERGADLRVVQEMLGHESITTTEIYTHINKQTLLEEVLMHHPRS